MADRRDNSQAMEGIQRGLVTHAVLVGLTPLIPVPVVDDLARNYFRRRLVRRLAAAGGRSLSDAELGALTSERGRGCLRGCLAAVVVYPLKAVFRKVFYFLEWKRAVDLASRTYHFGYLLGYAMRPREGGASLLDLCGAAAVGEAVQTVCREAPIKPVEAAVAGTFRQSRRGLRAAANLLARSLRRLTGRARAEEVAEAIEQVEPQEERELDPVVTRLQRSIASVPEDHFRNLRARLDARLGLPPDRA
ncbi:MAG TPA: hypothetical protein VHU19_02145 [Pyrinomonadaceae bacterium]|jgi:hypothetical protein|nr:hypothetical protein [Pyrinomonadaceae bacterium]